MRAGPSGNYHSFAYAPQTPVGVSRSSQQTPLGTFVLENGGSLIFCHSTIFPSSIGKNSRTAGMSIANKYLHNGGDNEAAVFCYRIWLFVGCDSVGPMVRDAGRCPAPHHEGLRFLRERLFILRSPP
jgi:hypothetical protein